jgi:DNA-binding HxlR family transcriptional regulator
VPTQTDARESGIFDPSNAARQVVDRIGTKWSCLSLLVLGGAYPAGLRFSEVRHAIPGIQSKTLSLNLQTLMAYGLVVQVADERAHGRSVYQLTELGDSLYPLVRATADWVEAHISQIENPNYRPGVALP